MIKYHAGESFLHKLDPRVKIIMLLILTILVFVTRNFPRSGAGLSSDYDLLEGVRHIDP